MGVESSLPVTAKESGSGSAPEKGLAWGSSCMQGWRESMEDAHFAVSSLGGRLEGVAAFGVFDGHGGSAVSALCRERLPAELANGTNKDDSGALVAAFEKIDQLLAGGEAPGLTRDGAHLCGCTATVCLVRPEAFVVANAGDCRAVLCRAGVAVPLSEDHKPGLPRELERIKAAGGFVEEQEVGPIKLHRVNGGLSCSRAIGDLAYKANARLKPCEQMVCSTPDVKEVAREELGDEFLILACDGVWDVMSSQDAVDFVRERIGSGQPLSGIADDLLDRCLSPNLQWTYGLGGDNMTVMIVALNLAEVDTPATTAGTPSPSELEEACPETSPAPLEGEAKACAGISADEPLVFANGEEGATSSCTRPSEERRSPPEVAPYFH